MVSPAYYTTQRYMPSICVQCSAPNIRNTVLITSCFSFVLLYVCRPGLGYTKRFGRSNGVLLVPLSSICYSYFFSNFVFACGRSHKQNACIKWNVNTVSLIFLFSLKSKQAFSCSFSVNAVRVMKIEWFIDSMFPPDFICHGWTFWIF